MIILGQIASADGASLKYDHTPTRYGYETRRSVYTCPASAFLPEQPDTITVDVDHRGPPIGTVAFLAQRGRGLFGVLDIFDDEKLPAPPWYLSAEGVGQWDGAEYSDVRLDRIGIVESSATVCKEPAVAVVGSLTDAYLFHANGTHRPLLEEAADYANKRRYSTPHTISAGEPFARTVTDMPSWLQDPPITAVADGYLFGCKLPGLRPAKGRLRLVYGNTPVGSHQPDLDRADVRFFTPVDTAASREAMALTVDGVIDRARPRIRSDGTTLVVELLS